MTKKRVLLIISIIILSFIPLIAYAHPGSLDSNGGHYNRSTGEYHYHEGLHTSGDSSSGSTRKYTYTTDYTTTTSVSTTTASKSNSKKDTSKLNTFSTAYIIIATLLIIIFVVVIVKKNRSIYRYIDKVSSLEKNNRELQKEYNISYSITKEILKHNSIEQIAKVPPDTKLKFENGKYTITQKGYKGKYGKYTGYVSVTGNRFHFIEGCSGAIFPVCLFDKDMIGNRTPCSKCYEPLIDDELLQEPNWFMPYCKIKEYVDTYINKESSNEEKDI